MHNKASAVSQRTSPVLLMLGVLLAVAPLTPQPAGAAAAPTPSQAAATAATAAFKPQLSHPATICKLSIERSTPLAPTAPFTLQQQQQPLQASLFCSGGPPISVAAHKSLADVLKQQQTAKGVTWDPGNCENLGCLLTICGNSSVIFTAPRVVGVQDQRLAAAVCITGNTRVEFQDGLFSRLSTSQGAILAVGAAKVTLLRTSVTNNRANGTLGFVTMGGGLLVQERAEVHIQDCTISGNRADGNVAALGAALAVQDRSRVMVSNSTFADNAAVAAGEGVGYSSGGALFVDGRAVVEVRNSTFTRNVANGTSLGSAGAVNVMHNATMRLVGCRFVGNSARSVATAVGGALIAMNSTAVNITNTTFASNAAHGGSGFGAGGAVFAANGALITVVGGSFVNNFANGSMAGTGAGVVAFDSASLVLHRTAFSGNQVASVSYVAGGAIGLYNDTRMVLVHSTVSANYANSSTASAAGGGVGVFDHAAAQISHCNITRNWVKGSGAVAGGGLFSQCTTGVPDETGKYTLCSAAAGGVGNISGPSLVVEGCLFESNSAAAYELTGGFAGGGAVGGQGDGRVTLRSSRFLNNHVAGISATDGGAVYGAGAAVITIDACEFSGNTAAGIRGYMTPSLVSCGGALAVQEHSSISVNSSSFDSNFVDGIQTCGGAACAINNGTLRIYSSRFVGNSAAGAMTCGGGVCASGKGLLHVEGVVFEGNQASGVSQGGAACATANSNATIARCKFLSNKAGWAGGAVGVGDGCVVAMSHCAFLNNSATNVEAGCGGAISIGFEALKQDFASCSIDSSTFSGNSAWGRMGSGGSIFTANAAVKISNSAFEGNVAQQGGALGGSGVSWEIFNTSFANHNVIGPGGALFTSGSLNATISHSSITHNRGSEGGGLYAATSLGLQTFHLSISNTIISSNEAQTGGGVFLRAGDTHIGPGTVISDNSASQQAGGLGWVGSCGNGEVCTSVLDISCDAAISSNTAAVAGGGLFVGQALNTHLEAPEADCAAQAVHNNSAAFGDADVFFVRGVCKAGEVSRGGWCDVCPPNMVSFDPQAGKCEVCPDHGVCLGGDVLLSEPLWWHSSNNSTQMHACPNPSACNHSLHVLNAHAPIDWQCSDGYYGHVCGSCSHADGYGFTAPFKCGRCMAPGKAVALYLSGLLLLIAFLAYSAHATWVDNQQPRVAPRVSDTIKCLVLYLNMVLILSSVRVDWPRSLGVLHTATAWLLSTASGQVLSVDCLWPMHKQGALPRAIWRQVVYLIVPVCVTVGVLLVFVAFWGVPALLARACRPFGWRRRRRAFSAFVAAKVPTAVLVCLYLFFAGLVRVAWGMFACLKLDVAGQQPFPEFAVATAAYGYWVQDMEQACYEGWHRPWSLGLGVCCTVLFCVGLPASLFWWLRRNRSRLNDLAFMRHYGFLYADFKSDRYWFEAVVAARTVVLVCIAVFSSVIGAYYGVVMLVVAFHASLALQLSLRPFAFAQLHRLHLGALSCMDIAACVTLTFFTGYVGVAAPAQISVYKEVAGALVLTVHTLFICWCLWVMMSGVRLPCLRACAHTIAHGLGHAYSKVRRHCAQMTVCCCHAKHARQHTAASLVPAILVPPGPQCMSAGGKGGTPISGAGDPVSGSPMKGQVPASLQSWHDAESDVSRDDLSSQP